MGVKGPASKMTVADAEQAAVALGAIPERRRGGSLKIGEQPCERGLAVPTRLCRHGEHRAHHQGPDSRPWLPGWVRLCAMGRPKHSEQRLGRFMGLDAECCDSGLVGGLGHGLAGFLRTLWWRQLFDSAVCSVSRCAGIVC